MLCHAAVKTQKNSVCSARTCLARAHCAAYGGAGVIVPTKRQMLLARGGQPQLPVVFLNAFWSDLLVARDLVAPWPSP
jgi:hypothetical protein